MKINYDNIEKLEERVEGLIDVYGAPENITDEIKEFLVGTNHAELIIALAIEVGAIKEG